MCVVNSMFGRGPCDIQPNPQATDSWSVVPVAEIAQPEDTYSLELTETVPKNPRVFLVILVKDWTEHRCSVQGPACVKNNKKNII